MAKHLIFLSEVSASPQTPCSSAFRLKDMHDKILQPEKIFQRGVSVSAILYCCPFLALISLRGIKMQHYGFRK